MFQNIVEVCNSVFTPVFTDPKIVFKWLWMIMRISACYRLGNLRGNLEH